MRNYEVFHLIFIFLFDCFVKPRKVYIVLLLLWLSLPLFKKITFVSTCEIDCVKLLLAKTFLIPLCSLPWIVKFSVKFIIVRFFFEQIGLVQLLQWIKSFVRVISLTEL